MRLTTLGAALLDSDFDSGVRPTAADATIARVA
jgi:hypothetical protein